MDRLELANSDIHEKAHAVMKTHLPELEAAGVRLSVFLSRKVSILGEYMNSRPSLKYNRQPALATIRLAKESERALGSGDAIILIDYSEYTYALDDDNRDALFFHELCHIKPKLAKDGSVMKHSDGRPFIVTIQHDFEIGLFMEPIRQMGRASTDFMTADIMIREVKAALDFHKKGGGNM